MSRRIAIVVPSYNGGTRLGNSVGSVASSGLPSDDYEIIVVDNASTDGFCRDLPAIDANGAPITVHRNTENVGRVENWNIGMRLAAASGARYALYLFVGDEHFPNLSLRLLLDSMDRHGSALGLSPFVIVRRESQKRRLARNIGISGREQVVAPELLLQHIIASGVFLLGPLQANVYRIIPSCLPQFDPSNPSHTDQEGTLRFLHATKGPVSIVAEPFLAWREAARATYITRDLAACARTDVDLLRRFSKLTGIDVDWPLVQSNMLLRYAYHTRLRPTLFRSVLRVLREESGPLRPWQAPLIALRSLATRHRVADFAIREPSLLIRRA